MNSSDNLKRLGSSVFGSGWQSKLARFIDVDPRTVRYWIAGEKPIPKAVILLLEELDKQS